MTQCISTVKLVRSRSTKVGRLCCFVDFIYLAQALVVNSPPNHQIRVRPVSATGIPHRTPDPGTPEDVALTSSSMTLYPYRDFSGGSRRCRNCGKTFTYTHNMVRHRRKCEGKCHLQCPLCGQQYNRRDHYYVHLLNKHNVHMTERESRLQPAGEGDLGIDMRQSSSPQP
ncbi:hypothetical protein BaRGS_00027487 [Batillaria attramentaria]|uniref:C2H2-type domain-containing protein n=1 Tax=Batillaria attramentaria TaxID=370345 RepID=A0ABD0K2D1_9CAEN